MGISDDDLKRWEEAARETWREIQITDRHLYPEDDTPVVRMIAELRRLREALNDLQKTSPPKNWNYYNGFGEWNGYGKRGDIDFVDEPSPGNSDDIFTFGVDVGEWIAANKARAALATQEKRNGC